MKSLTAAYLVVTVLTAFACSSDEKQGATTNPDSGGGDGGKTSSSGGKGNGGSSGASAGGSSAGGSSAGGSSAGGSANGGSSPGGSSSGGTSGSGNGGSSDASVGDGAGPDGSSPGDSGSNEPCIWIELANPAQCNKDVQIKNFCPSGRISTQLARCTDGSTFTLDTNYREQKISACPDTGCPNDSQHVLWRKVQCCLPSAVDGGGISDAATNG